VLLRRYDITPWLSFVPEDWPSDFASSLKVTYAIVATGSDDDFAWMPFFSKLNLLQHARQIALVGAKLGVARVDVR
jgi:uncharacterized protein (TIGR04141 family)